MIKEDKFELKKKIKHNEDDEKKEEIDINAEFDSDSSD